VDRAGKLKKECAGCSTAGWHSSQGSLWHAKVFLVFWGRSSTQKGLTAAVFSFESLSCWSTMESDTLYGACHGRSTTAVVFIEVGQQLSAWISREWSLLSGHSYLWWHLGPGQPWQPEEVRAAGREALDWPELPAPTLPRPPECTANHSTFKLQCPGRAVKQKQEGVKEEKRDTGQKGGEKKIPF